MNFLSGWDTGSYFIFLYFAAMIALLLSGPVVFFIFLFKGNPERRPIRILHYALSMGISLLVLLSFFINIGWVRVFLIWLLALPLTGYGTVFFSVQNLAAFYLHRSRALRVLSPISCVCYAMAYLCLPDGGDDGGTRAFFNLITGDATDILWYLTPVFLAGSVICIVLQTVFTIRTHKHRNDPAA